MSLRLADELRAFNVIGCIIALALFASCAGVPRETPPELYWPFPPEKPRVKFVDVILGSIDVTGTKSVLRQLLFGEEAEVLFSKPAFIAARGNVLYITDVNAVHIYDFKNKTFKFMGRGILGNATGIAVAPDGTVFVGDSGKKRVTVFHAQKPIASPLGNMGFFETPAGIAVDETNERVIVSDAKKHQISVWSLKGELLFSFGKRGINPGEFNIPYDVTVDKEGKIYVVDSGNFRIQVFDKNGNFIHAFGGVGMSPGTFARPKGIALDSDGHIYVVDSAFGNFQIFGPDGSVFLAVGANGTDPGKFVLPVDICINEDDKIYVVDQMNKRIQVLQYIKYPEEHSASPQEKPGEKPADAPESPLEDVKTPL